MLRCMYRSNHLDVLLRKGVLEICSKFTRGQPCRSVISIKLLCKFIKITLRHGYSPVNLLHIFRTPFLKNTSWWSLLNITNSKFFLFDEVGFLSIKLCYQIMIFFSRNFHQPATSLYFFTRNLLWLNKLNLRVF